ncbi:NUDIX hydrolase domain-like protein [Suillus paluster]|uniref:NUDIX hydrolase domain-like protein n=1 Tax=Suillus paluster TaxID=48578 RepID=UPI001B862C78|nr:NUDIX hydrolase domain-like protein [Suillus paluster]KAG1725269.1 NUDIX hydrolase domain-like protein [Suillus paluster]
MGEAFTNFLGGSPLNRLSWLRTSHSFLNAVVVSPTTRWILFNGGQPLIASHPGTQTRSLALLSTDDVKPLLGAEPFFGQCEQEGEHCAPDVPVLEAARVRGPPIVFLGLEEAEASGSALPSSDFKDPHAAVEKLKGTPYFSVDVVDLDENKINEVIENTELAKDGSTLAFLEPRAAMSSLDVYTAGIFAEARSMFCPACGSPVYSLWAGWKLACTSLLPWADNADKKPCPSGQGLHNFAHPRTDPVVIMAAIDESGEKILLGRNKKFPVKFYSALAGFIEPGESFEDAVKREMWEEAGVKVWNIRYHSGQPWPYPANLMVGFYATADSSAPIRTDLDNELEDARWYTREEVLAVLRHPSGTNFSRRDYKKLAEIQDGPDNKPATNNTQSGAEVNSNNELPFRIPSSTAIAGVLIQHWAEGKILVGADVNGFTAKGNL